MPQARRRGCGSRRSRRSPSHCRSGVHGLFYRQIGQGLKHSARRSFHSSEPLSLVHGRGAHRLGRPSQRRCILQKYAARHSGRPLPVHILHTPTPRPVVSPIAASALNLSKQCGRLPTSRWLTYRSGEARVRDARLICGATRRLADRRVLHRRRDCASAPDAIDAGQGHRRGLHRLRVKDDCACQGWDSDPTSMPWAKKKTSIAGATGGFSPRRMNFREKTRAPSRSRASSPAAHQPIRVLARQRPGTASRFRTLR